MSGILKPKYSLLVLGTAILVVGLFLGASTWRFQSQLAAAAFHNPFPNVVIAKERVIPDSEAYKGKYEFSANWFTWNVPIWDEALSSLKGKPDIHYLEIGLYEGRSAIWVLENILTHPTAKLTGIDPFLGPYKEKYFANIESSGLSQKVTTMTDYSQVALRKLELNSFDIIYIDGSHAEDDVLEDAVLCSRLLKEGGILIFDDYRWAGFFASGTEDSPTDFPKAAIDRFVQCFEKKFEVIHNSYQLILKKTVSP